MKRNVIFFTLLPLLGIFYCISFAGEITGRVKDKPSPAVIRKEVNIPASVIPIATEKKSLPTNNLGVKKATGQSGISNDKHLKPREIKAADSMILKGVISFTDNKLNIAVLKNMKTRKETSFSLGSKTAGGYRITKIQTRRIFLEKDGDVFILPIESEKPEGNIISDNHNKKGRFSHGYKKISRNKWQVYPEKLASKLSDMVNLTVGVNISNSGNGLLLEQVNDFLREIGLQKGDIVLNINGKKYENVASIMNYFWNLDSNESMDVNLIRDDKNLQLSYQPVYEKFPEYSKKDLLTQSRVNKEEIKVNRIQKIVNIQYK